MTGVRVVTVFRVAYSCDISKTACGRSSSSSRSRRRRGYCRGAHRVVAVEGGVESYPLYMSIISNFQMIKDQHFVQAQAETEAWIQAELVYDVAPLNCAFSRQIWCAILRKRKVVETTRW